MSGSGLPNFGAAEFLPAGQGGLPRGAAWPREPDATQTAFFAAAADCVAAVHAEAALLTEVEADAAATDQLLPDWERCYGLPDPCTPPGSGKHQRRLALLARIGAQGGQSMAYLTAVAATLGYTVTITDGRPFRVDISHVDEPLNDEQVIFWWQVSVGGGISAAPELECRLNEIADAEVELTFSYP